MREDKWKFSYLEYIIREKFFVLIFFILEFVDLIVVEYRKNYLLRIIFVGIKEYKNKFYFKFNFKDNIINFN